MIQIYYFPINIDTRFVIMNVELENFSMWFKSNKLNVNLSDFFYQ